MEVASHGRSHRTMNSGLENMPFSVTSSNTPGVFALVSTLPGPVRVVMLRSICDQAIWGGGGALYTVALPTVPPDMQIPFGQLFVIVPAVGVGTVGIGTTDSSPGLCADIPLMCLACSLRPAAVAESGVFVAGAGVGISLAP